MNDLPDAIERLSKRMETLEHRVATLEPRVEALQHPLAARSLYPSAVPEAIRAMPSAAAPVAQSESMFSVLGKAMLGVAGAYVLRAVEESSSLPRLAVAFAGIVYAFLWLAWAAKTRSGPRFASTIYACTSALILAPMLWELTLRFTLLPAAAAAGVICAYALAAIALAWKSKMVPVVRVGCVAAASLALALAIASHVMMPFAVALLIVTGACEFAPSLNRVLEVRAMAALAADAAIWILIFTHYGPQSAQDDPVLSKAALLAPGVAIFLLFAASVSLNILLKRKQITVFETAQTTIAFLLAAVSLADFGPAGSMIGLGIVCLALSAAIYMAVFTLFERTDKSRNAEVFSAWAAALFLAGSFLCLPPGPLVVLLGAGAILATIVGDRKRRFAFAVYGLMFLLAAASASGLLSFLVTVLIGTPPGPPALAVWLVTAAAILCYAVARPGEGEGWKQQVLRLAFAALAVGALAALLAQGLLALVAIRMIPGAHHLALIRTVTLCLTALVLVFAGTRWRRLELTRLGYAALALVAVKLVTEDLRHGHLAYIAASIFLVALTLIAAPRVARARQRTSAG